MKKPVNVYLKKEKSKVTVLIAFKNSYRSEIFSFAYNRNPLNSSNSYRGLMIGSNSVTS